MKTQIILRIISTIGLAVITGCISGMPVASRNGSDLSSKAFAKKYASHLKALQEPANLSQGLRDGEQAYRFIFLHGYNGIASVTFHLLYEGNCEIIMTEKIARRNRRHNLQNNLYGKRSRLAFARQSTIPIEGYQQLKDAWERLNKAVANVAGDRIVGNERSNVFMLEHALGGSEPEHTVFIRKDPHLILWNIGLVFGKEEETLLNSEEEFYLAFCNVLIYFSEKAQSFNWFSDFIKRNEIM